MGGRIDGIAIGETSQDLLSLGSTSIRGDVNDRGTIEIALLRPVPLTKKNASLTDAVFVNVPHGLL